MIYLNDNIEVLNVEEALKVVSKQRRQYTLRYIQENDRRLSLAVYLLLCEALKKEYNIIEPPEFTFGLYGKPLLKGYSNIHFNLSHCQQAALCVVSNNPIGCDVECVPKELDMDLCRHCFNNDEIAYIVTAEHPTIAFAELWTKKEALLKLTGEGLTNNLPELFHSQYSIHNCQICTHIAPNRSYVYSIASM